MAVGDREFESILPGVTSWTRRPGVLCLVPVWSLTAGLCVAVVAIAVVVKPWGQWPPGDAGVEFIGIVVSVLSLITAGEFKARISAYGRLSDRVAQLMVAWKGLEQASGLGWAVESNLAEAAQRYRGRRSRRRRASLERIYQGLRETPVVRRPATLAELQKERQERYHQVWRVNHDIVGLFHSLMDGRRRARSDRGLLDPCAADGPSLERLNAAMSQWEAAVALAKADVARWETLEQLIERCDVLVKQWWTFVQNDPYYRDRDPQQAQRRPRTHHQAKHALAALQRGVARRDIGQPFWRAWSLRLFIGRRMLATLDHQKDLIH